MAMNTTIPVKPILDLFRQNQTEALWMDYDPDADVLYVNFQRPSAADHSEIDESDTIPGYRGDRMIGFTILNASRRE